MYPLKNSKSSASRRLNRLTQVKDLRQKDLSYGILQENYLLSAIHKKYPNVQKTDQYCSVDYECDKFVIELKSRRCNHNKYPTTMISKSKIDYMLDKGKSQTSKTCSKRGICLFNFYDGLYEIEITPDVVNTFNCCFGGRHDRGRREYNIYYYIPIKMLKIFDIQKSQN